MKTRKLFRYHKKFYKYFRKILSGNKKPEEKVNIYENILEVLKKLKYFEFKGKIRYQTPIEKIAEVIEKDKNIIEQNLNADGKFLNLD
jgi:CRISPR/Cas system CSM-associated protein Csm2 small subunit